MKPVKKNEGDESPPIEESDHESSGSEEEVVSEPTRNHQQKLNAAEVRAAREAGETFRSNLFKLQVDEVLKEISVDAKYADQARKLLFSVREAIAQTKSSKPVDFKHSQRSLTSRIPFPHVEHDDIKYKFSYTSPELDDINVIGSWSLHTTLRRPQRSSGIDLFVKMDDNLFERKDYLDYRYHRKRAFFLASLASQLAAEDSLPVELRFSYFNNQPLKPVLQLVPTGKLGKRISIYIHAGVNPETFPAHKLGPHRTCDRMVEGPTPVYNWSVLSDMYALPLLRYLHSAAALTPAFADAVKLGGLWLLQRRWSSDPARGGFGAFELAVLMASLLNGGSKSGKRRLLPGYSSYQLLKGTLLYLAEEPFMALAPSFDDGVAGNTTATNTQGIVFEDWGLDVLANMPSWAHSMLKHDARAAHAMLNDSTRDRFDSLFLRDVGEPHLRFDSYFEVSVDADADNLGSCNEIGKILKQAWGSRCVALAVFPSETVNQGTFNATWAISSDSPVKRHQRFTVGAILTASADKRVTFVEKDESAEDFKQFWGPKASLRRFQNGEIKEAVVWEGHKPVVFEAAEYALNIHLSAVCHFQKSVEKALPKFDGGSFSAMSTSFQKMSQMFLELRSALPLRILAVFGTSAALRSASIVEPKPFVPEHVAEGVIEMESSGKWPQDPEAAEKVKTAFLIKIAEVIREQHPHYFPVIGLEANASDPTIESAFVTIQTPEGFYFKMRITSRSNADARLVALADHTRLMSTMSHRFPGLSGAMRLLKFWFERQMLMTHISEPAVELIALNSFVNSSPWSPPSSPVTGFWRAIDTLSRWDWRENALYLDTDRHYETGSEPEGSEYVTGCEMDYSLFLSMAAAFEKQRKQDPALTQAPWCIATKADVGGVLWTHWEPRSRVAAVIAARVTSLARASQPGTAIFKASTEDFDAVWKVQGPPSGSKHKNIAVSDPSKAIIGAHTVARDLVLALKQIYKDSLVLFYSGTLDSSPSAEHTLCAVWNRAALEPLAKMKANVPYPLKKSKDGFKLDKDAVLLEIDRLGSGMITRQK